MKSTAPYRWIVAFGSNLGDRMAAFRAARALLEEQGVVIAASRVYESAPMYLDDQPRFLNAALLVESALGPREMLEHIQGVEEAGQRVRNAALRFGPRRIDLDIVAGWDPAGEAVSVSEVDLTIPHPRMGERAFVLAPLLDVVEEWRPPDESWSARERLDALFPASGMNVFNHEEDWS